MEREEKEKRKYFLPLWKRMKPAQWIVLGFFGVIFVGGLLLSLPICSATGQSVGLLNGMFTATTSVCVTGLIVVDTGLAFSHDEKADHAQTTHVNSGIYEPGFAGGDGAADPQCGIHHNFN